MIYIYSKGNESRIERIVDEDGDVLEPGVDYEERDAEDLRECTGCDAVFDPSLRDEDEKAADNTEDERRCKECHEKRQEARDDAENEESQGAEGTRCAHCGLTLVDVSRFCHLSPLPGQMHHFVPEIELLWLVAFDKHTREYVALRKMDWHAANHGKPLDEDMQEDQAVARARQENAPEWVVAFEYGGHMFVPLRWNWWTEERHAMPVAKNLGRGAAEHEAHERNMDALKTKEV